MRIIKYLPLVLLIITNHSLFSMQINIDGDNGKAIDFLIYRIVKEGDFQLLRDIFAGTREILKNYKDQNNFSEKEKKF